MSSMRIDEKSKADLEADALVTRLNAAVTCGEMSTCKERFVTIASHLIPGRKTHAAQLFDLSMSTDP